MATAYFRYVTHQLLNIHEHFCIERKLRVENKLALEQGDDHRMPYLVQGAADRHARVDSGWRSLGIRIWNPDSPGAPPTSAGATTTETQLTVGNTSVT